MQKINFFLPFFPEIVKDIENLLLQLLWACLAKSYGISL